MKFAFDTSYIDIEGIKMFRETDIGNLSSIELHNLAGSGSFNMAYSPNEDLSILTGISNPDSQIPDDECLYSLDAAPA